MFQSVPKPRGLGLLIGPQTRSNVDSQALSPATTATSSASSASNAPPALPARSPLRARTRSATSGTPAPSLFSVPVPAIAVKSSSSPGVQSPPFDEPDSTIPDSATFIASSSASPTPVASQFGLSEDDLEEDNMPAGLGKRRSSFASLNALVDSLTEESERQVNDFRLHSTLGYPSNSYVVPDMESHSLSPVDMDESSSSRSSMLDVQSRVAIGDGSSSLPYNLSVPVMLKPATKRTHALMELLSSERAYASDLALMRDVHIPLALGQPTPLKALPATPPSSNGSRPLTVASDVSQPSIYTTASSRDAASAKSASSGSSSAPSNPNGAPMSREDVKTIFNNASELALFSDMFAERLEQALGDLLSGGTGPDRVGELFLDIIPKMEPPYKTYITKHSQAVAHLAYLTSNPTPAFTAYLSQTTAVATTMSNAWDLPSLLIKPVQRLLKYSLLLSAILAETPDAHPDKWALIQAREKMDEVARGVNEGRRRAEVVRDLLSGDGVKAAALTAGLARIKSLSKSGNRESINNRESTSLTQNEEATKVASLEKELRAGEVFIRALARHAIDWSVAAQMITSALRSWALSFARAIGLGNDGSSSEAFDAFLTLIDAELTPLAADLQKAVSGPWAGSLAALLSSSRAPLRLLDALHTLQPLHNALLTATFSSKTRPPPALLEASTSYIALRAQLAAELPKYLILLKRGLSSSVRALSVVQTKWWGSVALRWRGLWEALSVEGEGRGGAVETINVWRSRWREVEGLAGMVGVVRPDGLVGARGRAHIQEHREREREREWQRAMEAERERQLWEQAMERAAREETERRNQKPKKVAPAGIASMLGALDPTHAQQGGRQPSKSSKKSTKSGSSLGRRPSNESLGSNKSRAQSRPRAGSTSASRPRGNTMPSSPPIPIAGRQQNAPMPRPGPMQASSSAGPFVPPYAAPVPMPSSPGGLGGLGGFGLGYGYEPAVPVAYPEVDLGDDLGRKPSVRRKVPRKGSMPRAPSPEPEVDPRRQSEWFRQRSSDYPDRGSWDEARALYTCQVVHECSPPPGTEYRGMSFFALRAGMQFAVLAEAGHPSTHKELPLYIDDGEDCLLLVRDSNSKVGWALASFLLPLT